MHIVINITIHIGLHRQYSYVLQVLIKDVGNIHGYLISISNYSIYTESIYSWIVSSLLTKKFVYSKGVFVIYFRVYNFKINNLKRNSSVWQPLKMNFQSH